MVGMIMVDSMGDFDHVIWPLDESIWNGLSTADCVFPSFLFIMGLAVPLALKQEDRYKQGTWYKIFKRFFLLFLIGNLLNFQGRINRMVKESDFPGWRIMGVLQRISLCYLTVSCTYLFFTRIWFHLIFLACCLGIYIGFMYGFEVPNYFFKNITFLLVTCGRGEVSETCNFGSFVDRSIFGNTSKWMMYPNDPEGFFTTLSSLTNTYAGLAFSLAMRQNSQKKGTNMTLLRNWLIMATVLAALGGAMVTFDPVCKKRWSVSFAFFTSAMSGFALSLCFYVVDILNKPIIKETLCKPFLWLGMNPLFIFVAMIAFDNLLMNNIRFDYGGKTWNLWGFINEKGFASWMGDPYVASLTVSLLNLALWMAVAYGLFKHKIFIKL